VQKRIKMMAEISAMPPTAPPTAGPTMELNQDVIKVMATGR
jgi:hypothetical protein